MFSAESFDLTNGAVILRLICALFFIPHMYFKMFGNPYTQYAALLCASILTVAAVSVHFANGKNWIWLWPKGGIEYAVFWAIACVAVSLLHWH